MDLGVLDCLSPPSCPPLFLWRCGDSLSSPSFLGQPRKKSMACIDGKEMSAARCGKHTHHGLTCGVMQIVSMTYDGITSQRLLSNTAAEGTAGHCHLKPAFSMSYSSGMPAIVRLVASRNMVGLHCGTSHLVVWLPIARQRHAGGVE